MISFALALLFSLSSYGVVTKNCTLEQSNEITAALESGQVAGQKLISQIEQTVESRGDELSRAVIRKLKRAKLVLKCAGFRMKYMKFSCVEEENEEYFMKVLPIIGNGVKVNTARLDRVYSTDYYASMLLHEATHKCGTNDADYFTYNGKKPESTWYSSWEVIADTYAYWADRGFCIPEIDC